MTKAFKSNFKQLVRTKYGEAMTQREMSKRSGLREASISRWMRDDFLFSKLDMTILEPLAAFLDCDIEDLFEVVETEEDGESPERVAV